MSKVKAFLLGGIIGAAAALLLTPRTGAENLAYVKGKAGEVCGAAGSGDASQVVGRVVNSAVEKGKDLFEVAQTKGQEVCGAAVGGAEAAAPQAADSNDELRQKIEAARARIAAQMLQNAEESQAAVEEVIPVEAQVGEEPAAEEPAAEEPAAEEPAAEEPAAEEPEAEKPAAE